MDDKEQTLDDIALIFFGKFSAQLEAYASSKQVPLEELIPRLSGLFSTAASGEILGIGNHLSHVRRAPAEDRRRRATRSALAMDVRSHRPPSEQAQVMKTSLPVERIIQLYKQGVGIRAIAKQLGHSSSAVDRILQRQGLKPLQPSSVKNYYRAKTEPRKYERRKPHWTQLPENRARMMRVVRLAAKSSKRRK